jgi:colanic acid/amylovoran biosynthesis glycosyltransferase
MNLAIISPNQNAYSETFIQAHRKIEANIFYYYDGYLPRQLEDVGYIGPNNIERLFFSLKNRIVSQNLSAEEKWFAKSLIKNKIEIVFAEYGITGAYVLKVCKSLRIPLAVIFHGFDASISSILEEYRDKYIELFKYVKCVFSVSNQMKKKLVEMGCPAEKLIMATYGPNDMFLKIKPSFTEPRSFVSIGRFINKKAPYYTILAFRKVVEKYPDSKLYFAGNGMLLEATQNLVNYFNLQNNIFFLGIIKSEEFCQILSKVGGLVQHSITAMDGDSEGTPVAILEASAAGLPVVSTVHAGIPDVITDGLTGLLVNEHDVDSMAEKIIWLIENPEIAKELGTNGKLNVKQNFSMDKHIGIITKSIKNINEGKGKLINSLK